jgi:hypothetical protein
MGKGGRARSSGGVEHVGRMWGIAAQSTQTKLVPIYYPARALFKRSQINQRESRGFSINDIINWNNISFNNFL